MARPFQQVDVFTDIPLLGNPVAVVLDADGLGDDQLAAIARWTNLSETTFVLPPTQAEADYRVRIFTPSAELPFAGHPTLGTAHAWLTSRPADQRPTSLVQECGIGLVTVRVMADGALAFAAPPLLRSGPVTPAELTEIADQLAISTTDIVDAAWADNGPGWVAVQLKDAAAVRALSPTRVRSDIGVVGFFGPDDTTDGAQSGAKYEVRGFFVVNGQGVEDPVTGSLNASLAQWLIGNGSVKAPYTAVQGSALARCGKIQIDQDPNGLIWVAGGTVTCISGSITV